MSSLTFLNDFPPLPSVCLFSDLNYREELTPLRSFMITGYPNSRNEFHVERESTGLNRLNLIFHSFGFDTETEDIYFDFNDKKGKK